MLLKKNAVDLKLDLIDFFALLVIVHFDRELMIVVSEIVRNFEGLGKALGLPTLFGLAIDVESNHAASEIVLNRNKSSMATQEDREVDSMDG